MAVRDAALEGKPIEALRSRSSTLLRPVEEGYGEAHRVWNGAIDRHLALVG